MNRIFSIVKRRRIAISAAVFLGLVIYDLVLGTRPQDLTNLSDPLTLAGLALIIAGLALRSWAAGILFKDQELTTGGPYRLVRHPLYVGSFLMMFGFCALLGSLMNFWIIGGPILLLYVLRIFDEERSLAQRFGDAWHDYSQRTPRFFPRSFPTMSQAHWRLTRWLGAHEYRAVGTTVLALVALQLWHSW